MLNKFLKLILTLVILLAITSRVYAEEQSYDATIAGFDSPSIYDVDIKWDSMNFTFVEQEKYEYNESNHTYSRNVQKYWSSTNNNIDIKNKSSREVNISLKFKSLNTNIKGTFSKNNFNIKSSETQNIKLNLIGVIDSSYNEYKTVGEVSIVVS